MFDFSFTIKKTKKRKYKEKLGTCTPYFLQIFKISCLATQNHKIAASLDPACLKQGQSIKLCSKHRSKLLNWNQIMAAELPEGPQIILDYCCIFPQCLKPLFFIFIFHFLNVSKFLSLSLLNI
jgi:hypothetical protein